MAEAWLAQLGPVTAPTSAEPETPAAYGDTMANIPLSVVLIHGWRIEDREEVRRAILATVYSDMRVEFNERSSQGPRECLQLTVVEPNGWKHVIFYDSNVSDVVDLRSHRDDSAKTRPEPTFDPATVNVRIPIKLFLS